MLRRVRQLIFWLGLWLAGGAWADIRVSDDSGRQTRLAAPAQRIVSLAPSLTETLLDLGAGGQLVGVDQSSASLLPRTPVMGGIGRWDLERILTARPDLILVYGSPAMNGPLERLARQHGIALYYSAPAHLKDIPRLIQQIGALSGRAERAGMLAADLGSAFERLPRHTGKPLRVFYQVWPQPLITVNGSTFLSDAIRHCGGVNVFAGLSAPSPVISREAVLRANPELILSGDEGPDPLIQWHQFPRLRAVQTGQLHRLDADRLHRPGSRILPGVAALCRVLAGAH